MRKRLAASAALLPLLMSLGCGSGPDDQPQVAPVQGVITVNGQPRENLQIMFTPEKGRPSMGTTNENGEYTLTYLRDIEGAMLGKHTVQISAMNVSTSDKVTNPKPLKDAIPAEYNTRSKLVVNVAPGDNSLDFQLTTN